MRTPTLLAIDIGTTKVTCAVGQQTAGHTVPGWIATQPAWCMVGYGIAPYPLSTSGIGDPAVMTQALRQALRVLRVEPLPDRAIISVSHPHLKHATVTTRMQLADQPVTIRARDLSRLASAAVGQVVGIDHEPLLVEPVAYAGNGFEHVRDPRGLMATGLIGTFHLVSIPLAATRAIVQACDDAGIEVDRLVYAMKALAAGCEIPAEDSRVLLMDVGGACTDLALIEGGAIRKAATLSWGGRALTEAIAKTCALPLEQAVAVSVEGLSSQKSGVRELVDAHLRPLQEAVQDLLRNEIPPDAVVLAGRGALVDGFVEWLEAATQRPARLGRHAALQSLGELGAQLACLPIRGLFNLLQHPARPLTAPTPTRLVDRLLARTRHLLVEYF